MEAKYKTCHPGECDSDCKEVCHEDEIEKGWGLFAIASIIKSRKVPLSEIADCISSALDVAELDSLIRELKKT